MPYERDVEAFDSRAQTYETDWRGKMHLEIATRAVDLALVGDGTPRRVLDVGCGTGQLLRLLAHRLDDDCQDFAGVDPAPAMIQEAVALADDPRLSFSIGEAERLPYPPMHFDLAFATTSFDHWANQGLGVQECARVLEPGGRLILTDLFSLLLLPTLLFGHRGRARTRRRATKLLEAAGFTSVKWKPLYQPILATAVATK